jgi:hypothetical protein
MSKKEIVIVIPGAKYINSRNSIIKNLVLLFYRTTHVLSPVYFNYAKKWAKKFENKNRKVIWLRWNRGFTIWSRWLATSKLKKEIVKYKQDGFVVKIVGISLGGDIALRALRELGDNIIEKIVLVCSTNTDSYIEQENTVVFNVYSPFDLFVTLMTKLIAPIHGGIVLGGKSVENVCIEDFSHDEFCSDEIIKKGKFKGKQITDIIKEFLD